MLLYPAPVNLQGNQSDAHQDAPSHSPVQSTNQGCTYPVPAEASPVGGGGSVGGGMGATPVLRRSSRSTRGQTTRFEDFVTGSQFDNATNGLAFLSYTPTGYSPIAASLEYEPVLYAYKLPVGYERVSYMWNGSNWEMCPTTNYV